MKVDRIMHVSKTVPETIHDFRLLKDGEEIPQGVHVIADWWYEELKNIHENSKIPKKKPKKRELMGAEKDSNRVLSKARAIVENILGDIKIFQIMSDRYRNKRLNFNEKLKSSRGLLV